MIGVTPRFCSRVQGCVGKRRFFVRQNVGLLFFCLSNIDLCMCFLLWHIPATSVFFFVYYILICCLGYQELFFCCSTYAKTKWAHVLCVSTSGYYDWLNKHALHLEKDDKIRRKVIDLFKREGKGTYGAERNYGCMHRDGLKASFVVFKRIMD